MQASWGKTQKSIEEKDTFSCIYIIKRKCSHSEETVNDQRAWGYTLEKEGNHSVEHFCYLNGNENINLCSYLNVYLYPQENTWTFTTSSKLKFLWEYKEDCFIVALVISIIQNTQNWMQKTNTS